jgi:hypothetical protein
MNLPAPVLWIVGVLVGWLGLHVLSDLMVRSRRVRLQILVTDLKADQSYGKQDLALVDQTLNEARTSIVVVALPVLVPLALSSLAATGLRRRLRGAEHWSPLEALELMRFRDHELRLLGDLKHARGSVRADPRFRRLSELVFEIEAFRWPLISLLTMMLALPSLLLYSAIYGARETVSILPQLGFWLVEKLQLPRPHCSSIHDAE